LLLTLTKDDFADIRPHLRPDMNVWDNNGWAIRARNNERDSLVWASPYLIQSPPAGSFNVRDACSWQTMIVDVPAPRSIDAEMADNNFESEGWFSGDLRPGSDLKIVTSEKGEAMWSVGSSSISCAPPKWRIRTATPSTRVDIDIHTAYPSLKIDASSDLGAGKYWHTVMGDAELKLARHDGEELLKGFAFHERHTHADPAFNPSDIQRGEGIWWITAADPSFRVFVLMRPSMGTANAWIINGTRSEEIHGPDRIKLEQTRQWLDPRNRLLVPSGWKLTVEMEAGSVTAWIWAQARAYYVWGYLRNAYHLLYWWLANGKLAFRNGSGGSTEFLTQNFVHSNRVFVEKGR
jgi:hypothetical protein